MDLIEILALTAVQHESKISMNSLQGIIKNLESKISILIRHFSKRNSSMMQLDDEYVNFEKNESPVMLNSVDEIIDEVSPKNVLQETHVFLKQAMDTLKDSSMRIKELLEPVDMEDSEAHLVHKMDRSPRPFNTCDRERHPKINKIQQIEDRR
jgi:hypothetical protein